jgi:hypothetical protein
MNCGNDAPSSPDREAHLCEKKRESRLKKRITLPVVLTEKVTYVCVGGWVGLPH